MRTRLFVAIAIPSLACVAIIAAGCSLGLDASLINGGGDGGAAGDGSHDDVEGGGDGSGDHSTQPPPAGSCNQDSDCKNASACVKATHCDLAIHLCGFDVCPVAACQSAACDTMANMCSVPASFGFHASSFKVTTGGVGCGGVASRCFAAAYPFVFVGTTNGVVAYQVGDPANSAPPVVPVGGLPFLPSRIVSSGRRVYFIGNVVGSGPTYHLAIASLDVPQNPFVTAFAATTAFVGYPQPSAPEVFPSTNGAIFLVYPDSVKAWPTALVNAPIQDSSSISLLASPGIAMGASVVAASGSRLVTYHWADLTNGYMAAFSFENGAGTSNAQNGGETTASDMGTIYPQGFFAQGNDGSLLWSSPATNTPDGGAFNTAAARMTWLVADDKATAFAETVKIDMETYAPPIPYGSSVSGPMAWIDAKTALVIAAAKQDPTKQTSVQIASRTMLPASLLPGRRYVLPVDVNHVGAAASGAFAYALAADDMMNQSATVHVFAPSCM